MTSYVRNHGAARLATRMLSALLALAFLVSAAPQPAYSAGATLQEADNCAKNHTVAAGDTLSALSVTYNVSIQEIATANNLKEPYALSVGQSLCIPGAAQTSSGSTTPTTTPTATDDDEEAQGKTPSFTLATNGSLLTIDTASFPTKSVFFVKAGDGAVRDGKWIKIGRIRTKNSGATTASFRLPKELRNSVFVTVCVKNVVSDDVLCNRLTLKNKK